MPRAPHVSLTVCVKLTHKQRNRTEHLLVCMKWLLA